MATLKYVRLCFLSILARLSKITENPALGAFLMRTPLMLSNLCNARKKCLRMFVSKYQLNNAFRISFVVLNAVVGLLC